MKKTFKICLFIFIFFVVSIFKVNADTTVNYSCDYNFDGVKFRIRVYNLPQDYVKDAERIRSMSSVQSYVIPYYWPSDGSGSFKHVLTNMMDIVLTKRNYVYYIVMDNIQKMMV